MKSLIVCFIVLLPFADKRKPGNPLDHLPANIEILTHFGERTDISPGNTSIAFMAKSFGDATAIDLETRAMRCLTCNVPCAAFPRVMYLPSGDYILIGPDHFEDIHISPSRDNELCALVSVGTNTQLQGTVSVLANRRIQIKEAGLPSRDR